MEERIILYNDHYQKTRIEEFMTLPDGPRKHIQYDDSFKNSGYTYSELFRKDGNLHYAMNEVRVKRSKNSYYVRRHTTEGFTLDPKGKLRVWFNKDARNLRNLQAIFKGLRIDWVDQLPITYTQFITRIVLEKMLNGKITNPIDFCKQVLRNIGQPKASPKLMYNAMRSNTTGDLDYSYEQNLSYMHFIAAAKTAKDFNHFLEAVISNRLRQFSGIINDMQTQADILERKIDYSWSCNRFQQEHLNWTKEIMDLKSHNLSDEFIPALEWLNNHQHLVHQSMSLVKTEKEMYFEGSFMNHCVFTNYTNMVKRGQYAVYHVDYKGEQATAGIRIVASTQESDLTHYSLHLDQVRSFKNRQVSAELQAVVEESILHLASAFRLHHSKQSREYIPMFSQNQLLQVVNL